MNAVEDLRFEELFLARQKRSLSNLQEASWERFNMQLPISNAKETLSYLPLHKLSRQFILQQDVGTISSCIIPESSKSYLVFLNGVFRKDLSCLENIDRVSILSIEEAWTSSSYSSFLRHRSQVLLQQEEDPFALLNGALCQEGVFLYIPPNICLKNPIQLLFLQTESMISYTGPRVQVFAGANAELQLINTIGPHTFYNGFLDIALEEGARLTHASIPLSATSGVCLDALRASIKKDGSLRSFLVHLGGDLLRQDYRVNLLGPGADADLQGTAILSKSCQSHINVHMDHSAPSCRSNQLFKQVLGGRSRSSFTGKIYVRRSAQQTMAYQLQKNLLLSDGAIAYSKPNLEIFADDVKASHGSTTSQLNIEQLSYLRSRGVSKKEASFLLTRGFYQEILQRIPWEGIRNKALSLCQNVLQEEDPA